MFSLAIAARGSFKRQIILAFVVGFFFLISAFIAYMVKTESSYRYRDSSDATAGLAQSLAVSSLTWVLANDVVGLQEVVHSFRSYPELRYAMVISPNGRVLAHSDETKVGQFVTDEQSLALIKAPPGKRVMLDNDSIVDVAVPIEIDKRHVGWARVGLGREGIAGNLHEMILSNMLFVLLATALSLLAAILIANRLGYRIGLLVRVAEEVHAGNFATRANIPSGEDEITKLADSLNQMLDALEQNEERLQAASLYTRSLIEASLDPLVTISANGKITDVNKATEEATGFSRSELIGTDFAAYFTEPKKAHTGYQQVFSQGFVRDYPLTIRHRAGHQIDVLYNASVYRNEAGEVLGVFAAARDITERKKAEESTRISQARFGTIFNQAPLGIALIDSFTGQIYEVNPRFAEIAGRTIEEMTTIVWMSITHPDDVQKDLDNMALLNAGKITGFNMDKRYRRPDGSFVWINMTIAPLRGEQNSSPRHLCMIDDITERKQAEEKIRQMNSDLEQRVAERTAELESFAYSVSHDLRTPLRAIDGFSRLVLQQYEGKLDDEGKRLLNVVRDNTQKMGQLIDDILAFSRAGRLEIKKSETDMEALAHEVWQDIEPSMAGREVRLEIKPLPKMQGDTAMLRQVWVNLLGNAAKFTSPKAAAAIEVGGSLGLVANGAGNECTFYVKDNGVGFDMQYVDKLFGVFQRLHGIEEFEGTGIGLAIVKRIITRHGGRVWAEGRVNEGATFYFALPILSEEQS